MNKIERIYRHGDVILYKLQDANLENGTKTDELVLALGEVTGHAHRLKGDVEVLERDKAGDNIKFVVKGEAVLTHEEHDTIVLERGVYLKINQVEYNPFEDIIQVVKD